MNGKHIFGARRATSIFFPQGPTNAPTTFQYFTKEILQEYLNVIAVGILDDVIIFFVNHAKHVEHVRSIL